MTSFRRLSVLATASLSLTVIAAVRTPSYPVQSFDAGRQPAPIRGTNELGVDSLHELAAVIAFSERFEFPKSPAPPAPPPPVVSAAAPDERLVVTALAGGPPWVAVLAPEGGRAVGIVVRAGDSLATLRVLEVSAAGVRVSNGDSSWTIPLGRTQR